MSFSLSNDELQSISLVRRVAQKFPQDVLSSLKFQFPRLNFWQSLTPIDFVSLAYYGPQIIPATYSGLKGIIEKAYKDAVMRGEIEKPSRNEMYREAAEEYGLTSFEAFQQLYRELDQAAAACNAPTYARICNTAAYIEAQLRSDSGRVCFPKNTRHTYVETFSRYSPYLWDIFVGARQGLFPKICLDHFKGEVMYLHKTEGCVEAYIIGCAGYRRGVEQLIQPHMGQSTTDDLDEIRELSRKRFGDVGVVFKDMVFVGGAA